MTGTDFKSALQDKGFSFRNCGCNIFQVISTHGKLTDFFFDEESIWLDSETAWGKDRRKDKYHVMGICKFVFKYCVLKNEKDYVSVATNGTFLMFRRNKRK